MFTDLLFVYFLSIVLLFYTCLPLQYVTYSLSALFKTERKTLISALLNFGLLVAVLFLNRHYNGFYKVISQQLYPVFWLLANLLPLTLLLLPKNRQTNKKEDSMYALNKENTNKKVEKQGKKGANHAHGA